MKKQWAAAEFLSLLYGLISYLMWQHGDREEVITSFKEWCDGFIFHVSNWIWVRCLTDVFRKTNVFLRIHQNSNSNSHLLLLWGHVSSYDVLPVLQFKIYHRHEFSDCRDRHVAAFLQSISTVIPTLNILLVAPPCFQALSTKTSTWNMNVTIIVAPFSSQTTVLRPRADH